MTTIETWEDHEVTQAAISCNIGSGLLEAMRIEAHAYEGGAIIDVVSRVRITKVRYEPVTKDDFAGPWKRTHVAVPLAAVPVNNVTVGKILDNHLSQVSKRRELPGQTSIDDEITNVRPLKARKAAKDKPAKERKPRKRPLKDTIDDALADTAAAPVEEYNFGGPPVGQPEW